MMPNPPVPVSFNACRTCNAAMLPKMPLCLHLHPNGSPPMDLTREGPQCSAWQWCQTTVFLLLTSTQVETLSL
eukprot:1161928-Pelagomonas_calceolata.AAC.2